MNQPSKPQYTPSQLLDELIAVTEIVGGSQPKEIKINKKFREAFIKEREIKASDYGLQKDSQITNLTFRGVKLV